MAESSEAVAAPDPVTQDDVRYTLAEARRLLNAEMCSHYGHDWEIVYTYGDPHRLICSRCGEPRVVKRQGNRSWSQDFKPGFDVFAGSPIVACECGWFWTAADGADSLATAIDACERHAEQVDHHRD